MMNQNPQIIKYYLAYGLKVRSSVLFPELQEVSSGDWDLEIRLGKVTLPAFQDSYQEFFSTMSILTESGEAYIAFRDPPGVLRIVGGKEIIVDPPEGMDERLLRLHLLGPAMGTIFHQRGRLALHSSAVASGGEAVAFIGESRMGKSTLAASLHQKGYGLVTDDVLPIEDLGISARVHASFPRLKLWEDAAAHLGYASESTPRIHQLCDKYDVRVKPQAESCGPFTLKRIYVLTAGDTQRIEPIEPHEAVMELMRHTYRIQVLPSARESAHFQLCAGIAQKVSVCRLVTERVYDRLPELCSLIEKDGRFL